MKIRLAVAAASAVAALALSACGGEAQPAADTPDSPEVPVTTSEATAAPVATSEATAAPVAAPASGDTPSQEFVVGKWGTDGDCTLAVDLRADGTSDGPFGDWSYSDGVISFADAPELTVTVTVIDENTMESNNGGDDTQIMTRCP